MNRPALPAAVASHLLWAAALLDAVFVFAALQILGPLVLAMIELAVPQLSQGFSSRDPAIAQAFDVLLAIVCFLVLLEIYWAITEIALRGRSIGRLVLGLELRRADGSKPKPLQISKRAVRKMTSVGLAGLAIGRLDQYDLRNGLVWTSPMVEGKLSAARNMKIEILSGGGKNTSHQLEQLPSFRDYRGVKIGRDKLWADILLDRDGNVSNQHALIRLRQTGWQIKDYGGGKGSSNKTRIGNQVLDPARWYPLKVGQVFSVADVRMRLSE